MHPKILTNTQEEYDKMVVIARKNNIPKHCVYRPEDSVASVAWSIEDVRELLPENRDDDMLFKALNHVSRTLSEDMIARGWETLDILTQVMLDVTEEKC